jgi:hypothetical protein
MTSKYRIKITRAWAYAWGDRGPLSRSYQDLVGSYGFGCWTVELHKGGQARIIDVCRNPVQGMKRAKLWIEQLERFGDHRSITHREDKV